MEPLNVNRGALLAALALSMLPIGYGGASRPKGPRSADPHKKARRKMAEASRKRNR